MVFETFYNCLGQLQVVKRPVNAHPGLEVNQSINFPRVQAHVLCSLRLFKLKIKDKQYKQKTSPKSYKTTILQKFSLILGCFEQPDPGR